MSKSTTNCGNGRLCNQIIRNLSLSLLAEKYDLDVAYSSYHQINNQLGIKLFVGNKKYDETIEIHERNYMDYLNNKTDNNYNFNAMRGYFQEEEITTILHNHLKTNMATIFEKNPYKERYNNNNDLFLHVRLTDTKDVQVGIDYFIHCIKLIKYDKIYIGSDDFNDDLIKKLQILYPDVILVKKNAIETIQFASTCKHIILSHGSFSAVIGYLGFFSNVYFLNKPPKAKRLGLLGMFLNKGFIPIDL